MNILIIEDDPFWQSKLQMMLIQYQTDISVTITTTKAKTCELLNTYTPDLVLADIILPDGYAFEIFKTDVRPYPIVFLTGHPDEEYLNKALALPKTSFVVKPFHPLTLQGLIQRLLPSKPKANGLLIPGRFRNKFFLSYENVLYIESERNYVHINLASGQNYTIKRSLTSLLSDLDQRFCQVHKAFVINTDYLNRLDLSAKTVILKGKAVPVGRTYRKNLITLFK